MMSRAEEKLSKLKNFGMLAGSGPAAAAREAIDSARAKENKTPEIPPSPAPEQEEAPVRSNLVRNVVFLPADQDELDRLEEILRAGGIRKASIADVVRLALRAAAPEPKEAAQLFRQAKALDARFKANRKRHTPGS